jgi:hypothetical protein
MADIDSKVLPRVSVKVPKSYDVEANPSVPAEVIPPEWRTWERDLKRGDHVLKKEEMKIIPVGDHVNLFIPKDCLILAEGGEYGFVKRWAADTGRTFFCNKCPRNSCQHQGKTLIQ